MSGVSGEHQGHQGIAGNGIPALVEPSWVQSRLADEATRIFDVTVQAKLKPFPHMRSGRREFKHGHVPGAGFADLRRICDPRAPARTFTMPEAEWFAEKMGRLGIGDENRVVLYDARESMWAARLYWMLRAFGFDNAAVMNGGWTSWSLEHRPVSTDPAAYPPARFTPDQCADLFVGKDDVLAALDDPTTSIVCALGHRQFIGEHREYGRRRGHIPTAKNISAWTSWPPYSARSGSSLTAAEAWQRAASRSRSTSSATRTSPSMTAGCSNGRPTVGFH